MKHVGKYGEKPCIVLFREVPDEPENCLIVLTGALQDREHDDLMQVIGSSEGQQASEFSAVLQRRDFTNGANMLRYLHEAKKITKVPVNLVHLTPTPAQQVPLADVNAEIRKLTNNPVPLNTDPSHLDTPADATSIETLPDGTDVEVPAADPKAVADSLMAQAELLEGDAKALSVDAKAKRAEAKKVLASIVDAADTPDTDET